MIYKASPWLIGKIWFNIFNPCVQAVGRYMTYITLAMMVLQIAAGIVVKIVNHAKRWDALLSATKKTKSIDLVFFVAESRASHLFAWLTIFTTIPAAICNTIIAKVMYVIYLPTAWTQGLKILNHILPINQGEALYIINSAGIASHQAAGGCTLTRDEIQPQRG